MTKLRSYSDMARPVASLSVPVLIEQAGIVLMGVINVMIASNMGRNAISAIGMIDSVNNVVISVFGALAIGGTVVVAQQTGNGNRGEASRAAGQALLSCLAVAAVTTLLALAFQRALVGALFGQAEAQVLENARVYFSVVLWSYLPIALVSIAFGVLRGSGDTRTPMAISLLMNLFNVVFSYVLIYGVRLDFAGLLLQVPALGVRGAAVGLTAARTLGAALAVLALLRESQGLRVADLRNFRFDLALQKCIFRLGVPASLEQLMFNGGKLIVQTFIVGLGTVAMAATVIAGSASSLLMIPGSALSTAAVTLVGQQVGRGQPAEARRRLGFVIGIASAAMGVLSLLILPFAKNLLGLYTQDAPTLAAALPLLLTIMVAQPLLWPASFVTPAGLRGAGDVRYTMTVSIISMWVLRILLGYVFTLVFHWGILGIWLAMYTDWVGRSFFFIRRMMGDRWLKAPVFTQDPELATEIEREVRT